MAQRHEWICYNACMTVSDLRYLAAYILPAAGFLAVWFGGIVSFLAVAVGFFVVPVVEFLLPPARQNPSETAESSRAVNRFFDWLLYLNVPLVYGLIGLLFTRVAEFNRGAVTWWELIGMCASVGLVMAANGINVAHELGHRISWAERSMSKLLLLPCLYLQFHIDHNRGHHLHVGTPMDPSTARRGESLYRFWARAVPGIIVSAWGIEARRLSKQSRSAWSPRNALLRYLIYEMAYLAAVWCFLGHAGLVVAIAIAIQAMLTLETIDYIEHYGLTRAEVAPGKYERVQPKHSWNSNHLLGRTVLYELTRHSDHHAVASRPYQLLRHCDPSPELPFGYPTSMMLALVPWVWFRMMDPRIPEAN